MKKVLNCVKNMYEKIVNCNKTPMLGRWTIKKCDNNMTNIKSVYQNRDHCGDIICKTPVKAKEYNNK
jgi:hypothetical protein